ncbi:MAG TPA: PTS sugar transporter subunit IIA [Casimicrobiaceae bacterium]|nr:PTS sugar transporter subunit IIA [Casimicrobiaceae bacterium]
MGEIARLLPRSNIVVDLDIATKHQFFEAMGSRLEESARLARGSVAPSLAAREKLGSTGLGQGVAIPHGRIKGLSGAIGAFARLRSPISFEAPDGKPVAQLFVLLVPERATDLHLQLLSKLAQMFADRAFRDQLAATADAGEIAALFDHWEPAG